MVKKHHSSTKKFLQKHKTRFFLEIFLALIIIVILVFGALQLVKKPKQDLTTYNGFTFEHRVSGERDYWVTHVQLSGQTYEVPFYYHPSALENYSYDTRLTKYILHYPIKKIIIAVHPKAGSVPVLAGIDLARVTGKFYGIPTASALYVPAGENYSSLNLTQVNCNDATNTEPIIWLTNTTVEPKVILSNDTHYCIIVSGQGDNILAAADLMAYKLLGILT